MGISRLLNTSQRITKVLKVDLIQMASPVQTLVMSRNHPISLVTKICTMLKLQREVEEMKSVTESSMKQNMMLYKTRRLTRKRRRPNQLKGNPQRTHWKRFTLRRSV
uniref:Uncharacterized protein n=1 Tax=Cacopsylla melanoneura TaxID=428564 RepID=A0A8D8S1J3_9HEMI